jgi:hypothetical protein
VARAHLAGGGIEIEATTKVFVRNMWVKQIGR